jgi:U3 small nucleolar RNA-associated protein 18
LKQRRCVAKVADEGSFQTTVIDASNDGRFLATGSKMGTVNIFSLQSPLSSSTVPEKTMMNLTTAITDLKFSPTSDSLSFCSKWKKDAVRMAHIPSYTAFQNFPGAAVGILKYPFCLDYSKTTGEYMAMGTDDGKVHLWHMPYFSKAN